MKLHRFPLAVAAITAALAYPALALDAPEDNAPPPPAADEPLPQLKLPPAEEKAAEARAFLGVVSSDVPEMLAQHLAIEANAGVVVRALVPDGPAAKAGLEMYDVITKVGGKAVGSPEDISNEIASHQPGDTVSLDLIHKGKPATREITLGTRPDAVAAAGPRGLGDLDLGGLPKELAERLRKALEGNIGGMDMDNDDDPLEPNMNQALLDLQQRMQGAIGGAAGNAAGEIKIQSNATVKVADGDGSVEVQTKGKSKEVTICDKDGNVTWRGPWDTPQDKAAAPDEVRERVEALKIDSTFNGPGIRLQMRQNAPDH